MNNTEIKVSVKDIPEVIEQLEKAEKILLDKEKLEKENKQLKEEKRKVIEYIKNKKQFQKGCDIHQIID